MSVTERGMNTHLGELATSSQAIECGCKHKQAKGNKNQTGPEQSKNLTIF